MTLAIAAVLQEYEHNGHMFVAHTSLKAFKVALRRPGLMARTTELSPDCIGRVMAALASNQVDQRSGYKCVKHCV